jgi:hypothetical protein
LRELGFDPIDSVNNIRTRLLKHCEDDTILVGLICRYSPIDRLVDCLTDVTDADRSAVVIAKNNVVEWTCLYDLVIGGNGEARYSLRSQTTCGKREFGYPERCEKQRRFRVQQTVHIRSSRRTRVPGKRKC